MDCCCPADHEPLYGVYVNNLQSVRVAQKSKFSFRTTAAASEHSRSRLSRSSLSEDQEQHLDEELRRLEEEYERLREEEAEIERFEQVRVRSLEEEVAFYEREIRERSRDIDELHHLFRAKLQERQALPHAHPNQYPLPPQAQLVHLPQGYVKSGDETSISSIQPNS
jgi:small-conductance mechanosensitive channel